VATKLIATEDFVIPAGVGPIGLKRRGRPDRDVLALAFFPHMHLRGKSFRYARVPGRVAGNPAPTWPGVRLPLAAPVRTGGAIRLPAAR